MSPGTAPAGGVWQQRAEAAYGVLLAGYWRPRLRLFRTAAPDRRRPDRLWRYWWQAHALDAVVDAYARTGRPEERARAQALVRGMRLRNGGHLRNRYYDDLAWLGLALQRAGSCAGLPTRRELAQVGDALRPGYDARRGAFVWRAGDDFCNVPTNAPVAILAARLGKPDLAARLADWVHARLVDDGRVLDGVRGDGRVEPAAYTYNYGTLLGADLALYEATGRRHHLDRAGAVAAAAARDLLDPGTGLLPDEGGGDGGLFKGILARYLGAHVAASGDAATAALLVRNGEAAWAGRDPRGLVGSDWSRPADGSPRPPVELSVHLSGVLLFEALATLERTGRLPR